MYLSDQSFGVENDDMTGWISVISWSDTCQTIVSFIVFADTTLPGHLDHCTLQYTGHRDYK